MILVTLEHIDLELRQAPRGTVEKPASLRNLLEKERIGVIDDGHIHFVIGVQYLQFVPEVGQVTEGQRGPAEQDREVEIAPRMHLARHHRAEFENQLDAELAGDSLQAQRVHPGRL